MKDRVDCCQQTALAPIPPQQRAMGASRHAEPSAFAQALDAHMGLAWTRWHTRAPSQGSNMEATRPFGREQ